MACQRCNNPDAEPFEMMLGILADLCNNCWNTHLKLLHQEQNFLDYRNIMSAINAIIDNEGHVKDGREKEFLSLEKQRLFLERELVDWLIKFVDDAEN